MGFLHCHKLIPSVVVLVMGVLCHGADYKPQYQPELDQISLQKYIVDEYLFNQQINCLLFNGPCDPVGKWLKPRMASNLLSSCILCTPNQEKEAEKFITFLYVNHPQLFRMGVSKYLDANGITLPENSKYRDQVQKMNVPKVASHTTNEKNKSSREVLERDEDLEELLHGEEEEEPDRALEQDDGHDEVMHHSTSVEQREPQRRIFNPNSRKNKFSSAMMFDAANKANRKLTKIHKKPFEPEIEDDEAELDYKIYY